MARPGPCRSRSHRRRASRPPDRLEEKPGAALGFIDPGFEHARRGHVAVVFADLVLVTHRACQTLVIGTKLGQHVSRGNELFAIVFDRLMARDIADRAERSAADLPRPDRKSV